MFIITSIYVISCLQLKKGTFSYYVITQGPIFGSPLPSCSHLFNFGSPLPLPFERSKLTVNPLPPPPISIIMQCCAVFVDNFENRVELCSKNPNYDLPHCYCYLSSLVEKYEIDITLASLFIFIFVFIMILQSYHIETSNLICAATQLNGSIS